MLTLIYTNIKIGSAVCDLRINARPVLSLRPLAAITDRHAETENIRGAYGRGEFDVFISNLVQCSACFPKENVSLKESLAHGELFVGERAEAISPEKSEETFYTARLEDCSRRTFTPGMAYRKFD